MLVKKINVFLVAFVLMLIIISCKKDNSLVENIETEIPSFIYTTLKVDGVTYISNKNPIWTMGITGPYVIYSVAKSGDSTILLYIDLKEYLSPTDSLTLVGYGNTINNTGSRINVSFQNKNGTLTKAYHSVGGFFKKINVEDLGDKYRISGSDIKSAIGTNLDYHLITFETIFFKHQIPLEYQAFIEPTAFTDNTIMHGNNSYSFCCSNFEVINFDRGNLISKYYGDQEVIYSFAQLLPPSGTYKTENIGFVTPGKLSIKCNLPYYNRPYISKPGSSTTVVTTRNSLSVSALNISMYRDSSIIYGSTPPNGPDSIKISVRTKLLN